MFRYCYSIRFFCRDVVFFGVLAGTRINFDGDDRFGAIFGYLNSNVSSIAMKSPSPQTPRSTNCEASSGFPLNKADGREIW